MFLLGNLIKHGTQEMVHRHGTTFFVKDTNGEIEAVAGVSNGGFLMCQAPRQPVAFWANVVARMKGREVVGITGAPDQTMDWISALEIETKSFSINDIEPLFEVMLEDVRCPVKEVALRRPQAEDAAFLGQWITGFNQDTGLAPAKKGNADDAAQEFIANTDTRILTAQGAPVAMTALNARLKDAVQVSSVYVPPAQRGRGYGGAAVALHLQALAKEGVKRAVLFAASEFAAQAYRGIGFQQVGGYRVAILKTPMVVGGASGA